MFPWDNPAQPAHRTASTRRLPSHSRYVVEARNQARRAEEARHNELVTQVRQQKTAQLQATSDVRVSNLRRRNDTLRMAGESLMEHRLQQVRCPGPVAWRCAAHGVPPPRHVRPGLRCAGK